MSTKQKLLRVLAGLLVSSVLVTSGCSWGKQNNQPTVSKSAAKDGGSWLCEAGKAAADWDCIQSEDIGPQLAARNQAAAQARKKDAEARNQPSTPPETPTAATEAATETPRDTTNRATPQNLPTTPQPIIDGDAALRPQPQPAPALRAAAPANNHSRPLTTASAERPSEPAYAQLAYRPDEPVRLIDLPENFYAAQLLAVSTKKQIEDFVVAQNLYNMSAARIEQNGRVLYVLLLGVYESKAIAQSAVAVMPTQVQSMQPWIRPIGGLQDAMLRGDQLAATAGIR